MFEGKLDVGRREDLFYLFFLVFTRCLGKNWTSEGVKTFFRGGGGAKHCLVSVLVVPPSLCQILGAPLAQTYHDKAMFSVGKWRKILFGFAKRTHFFAKCTSSNITKTSCATCFQ